MRLAGVGRAMDGRLAIENSDRIMKQNQDLGWVQYILLYKIEKQEMTLLSGTQEKRLAVDRSFLIRLGPGDSNGSHDARYCAVIRCILAYDTCRGPPIMDLLIVVVYLCTL